eukprot:357553-Chlamydomonas_euryale.AAC.3
MDRLASALGGYEAADGGAMPGGVLARGGGGAAAPGEWRGVGYVRIDGAADMMQRRAAVREFAGNPAVRVALLSVTAAAVRMSPSFSLFTRSPPLPPHTLAGPLEAAFFIDTFYV